MDLHLDGKIVAVTGASGGIGRKIALAFAKEGCKVAICARSSERLENAADELRGITANVLAVAADVTEASQIRSFGDAVCAAFGRIDIWVNNAGATMPKPILSYTEADWDYASALNLKSMFFGCQYALSHMSEAGGGVILNISSYSTVSPLLGAAVYAATKSGIISLTRSFAAEGAPYGVRSVSVTPGTTWTEMSKDALSQSNTEELYERIALRRFAEPEEIAAPVVFLASDVCSYITGADLEISGGKLCVQNPGKAWGSLYIK